MKRFNILVLTLTVFLLSGTSGASEGRAARQELLDDACESARASQLEPLRRQHVDECSRTRGRDACERFYRDYGARTETRFALFYDLPECVEAFEYRRSYQRRD